VQPPVVPPALSSAGAPLVTRPLETALPPVLRETEISTTTTNTAATTALHPVPAPSTVSAPLNTAQSPSALVDQGKEQTAPARGKTGPAKKKKRKTSLNSDNDKDALPPHLELHSGVYYA